jgi:hypothetical protein
MVRAAVFPPTESFDEIARSMASTPDDDAVGRELFSSVRLDEDAWGPTRLDTACGFKVRGARLSGVVAGEDRATLVGDDGTVVGVALDDHAGCSVLLTLENGLRAVTASAVRYGVFRIEHDDAPYLLSQVRSGGRVDPTMALYAAYAFRNANRRGDIRQLKSLADEDLGVRLFDLDMLAGISKEPSSDQPPLVPALPLLGQGWAFVSVSGTRPPESLHDIQRHVLPSLWTLYDPDGVARLRDAIRTKELS